MRQTTESPISQTLPAPKQSSFAALVLRLAVAFLLLAGLTVLASVALAANF